MPKLSRNSKKHEEVYALIKKIFPNVKIIEEYAVRNNGKTFNIDLYIPQFKIGIEIQGRQHTEYVPFLHKGSKDNFVQQQVRDMRKFEACLESGIDLKYVYQDEALDENRMMEILND